MGHRDTTGCEGERCNDARCSGKLGEPARTLATLAAI